MDNQSFLIFKVQDLSYAIPAPQVREVLKLPELTPVTNMPADIIGILNYRGQVLPTMHLARRFGQAAPECKITDSLIVVESQDLTIGMVVHSVEEVTTIDTATIQFGLSLGRQVPVHEVFLAGIATVDERMIMLLNPETLIRETDEVAQMSSESALESKPLHEPDLTPVGFFERYCPRMTSAEQEVLHQRAAALGQSLDSDEDDHLRSLAVMRLGEEYFGIDLEKVREFIRVSNVTPIPCCPSHIIGNMNLRGEVMTLIDIRSALNVATSKEHPQTQAMKKAIVVDVDGVVAGIPVDRLCEIVYVAQDDIAPVPAATTSAHQNYFSGIAAHEDMMLSILDFPKLLATENLVVNEMV